MLLVALETLRNSAPKELFARDIQTVKLHPYNIEAKVFSFFKKI